MDLMLVRESLPDGACRSFRSSELVQVAADVGAGGMEARSPDPLHLSEKTLRRGGRGGGLSMEESWVKEYIVDVDELAPPKSSAPRLKAAVLGGRHGGRGSLPPSAMAAALHAPVMLQCRYCGVSDGHETAKE